MSKAPVDSRSHAKPPSKLTLFLASCVGTSIEWYDYFIFGTAAALVLDDLFFPSLTPVVATLAAFSSFAVGFVFRPLGAMLFGHLGDRVGRKTALVLTLVITGLATFLMGVLPTYAAIGVAAPVLLVCLRLVQGFAVGGEWGGAVLVSSEHAPARRRILYGSFAQFGLPIGVLLSNMAFLMVSGLSDEAFRSWGWRLPFLASAVLVLFGFWVRRKLEDGLDFQQVKQRGSVAKVPLAELLRRRWPAVLMASLVAIAPTATGNAAIVYMLNYGTSVVGFDRSTMLFVVAINTLIGIPALLVAALLADRFGARRVFAVGAALTAVWVFPLFALVNTGNAAAALAGLVGIGICLGFMSGPQGGLFARIFEPNVRYSGMSLAYQLGGVAGGATPAIATALYAANGSSTPVALYVAALACVSLVSVLALRTAHAPTPTAESPATTTSVPAPDPGPS